MNIFLVYVGDILHCPPAMTVIQTLSDLNINVVVCTNEFDFTKTSDELVNRDNVIFKFIGSKYKPDINLFNKVLEVPVYKKKIWNIIEKEYCDNDLIWIIDGGNVKYLGAKLLKYKYILHLLELTEELYYVESKHMFPISRKYAKNAACVIECEYNRAHITKAWWDLKEIPMVLPNKPYVSSRLQKNGTISTDKSIRDLMFTLNGKKIVLYQGNISAERPLKPFLDAVEELGDPFVFVAMVNGDDPFPDVNTDRYYHIPFVNPPYHLEITSHAYIGVLAYTPIKNDYSILNTLYCAPNKIWEYSMFDIPMISNDLPALNNLFSVVGNGKCFDRFNKDSIKAAILNIDANYESYSLASKHYFNSVDIFSIVKEIIDKALA